MKYYECQCGEIYNALTWEREINISNSDVKLGECMCRFCQLDAIDKGVTIDVLKKDFVLEPIPKMDLFHTLSKILKPQI